MSLTIIIIIIIVVSFPHSALCCTHDETHMSAQILFLPLMAFEVFSDAVLRPREPVGPLHCPVFCEQIHFFLPVFLLFWFIWDYFIFLNIFHISFTQSKMFSCLHSCFMSGFSSSFLLSYSNFLLLPFGFSTLAFSVSFSLFIFSSFLFLSPSFLSPILSAGWITFPLPVKTGVWFAGMRGAGLHGEGDALWLDGGWGKSLVREGGSVCVCHCGC